jgi:hypothetical protein
VPEEPVTLDELERLLLRLTGNSAETLEQQILSRLKRETLVGGKRVTRQEWAFNEHFADLGDLFNVGDLNERLAGLATVLIPVR